MLEPLDNGEQFIGWPLHITLVPTWFGTAKSAAAILGDVSGVAEAFQPFAVRGIQRTRFGWRGSVPVTAVASPPMHDLHRGLLAMLQAGPYTLLRTNHMGDSYQPHVTKKGSAEFKPGHEVMLDRIYLVKAAAGNRRTRVKTIIGTIEL